jgi:N-acetylglutamate synthase-like GNAT family acetyltransferase
MAVITRVARTSDLPCLGTLDQHLAGDALTDRVAAGRVLVAEMDGVVVGCLRWGLFWGEVPFMNLLWVLPDQRGHGAGRALVDAWERSQADAQHTFVLTSTVSAEAAQHFFRHLGYVDCGALLLPGEPAELFLRKDLQQFTSRTVVGRSHRANDHS